MLVARAEYNYYPELIEDQNKKKTTIRMKKVRAINKRMYITIAIILFFTSLFILHGYAKISEARLEITNLERAVVELQKTKQDLEGNLEGIKNTTNISEIAKNNLGMMYPEAGQIIYINMDADIQMEVANNSINEKLREVLSNFSSLF